MSFKEMFSGEGKTFATLRLSSASKACHDLKILRFCKVLCTDLGPVR